LYFLLEKILKNLRKSTES